MAVQVGGFPLPDHVKTPRSLRVALLRLSVDYGDGFAWTVALRWCWLVLLASRRHAGGFVMGDQLVQDHAMGAMGVETSKVPKVDGDVQTLEGFVEDFFAQPEMVRWYRLSIDKEGLDCLVRGGCCSVLDHGVDFEHHQDRYVVLGGMLADPIFGGRSSEGFHVLVHKVDDERLVGWFAAGVFAETTEIGDGCGDVLEG